MKMKTILLILLVLFVCTGCSSQKESTNNVTSNHVQNNVNLYNVDDYYAWPVDVFSAKYYPVDGSDMYYEFVVRPDGQVVLQGQSLTIATRRHQYPLRDTEVYIREDGYAVLHFVEDYRVSFAPNGVLDFGKVYWPLWLTEKDQANRSLPGNVLGGTVEVIFVDQGYYRIGNGTAAKTDGLHYVPNGGSPVLVADKEVSNGFCVYNGWIYMDDGKTDTNGNYVSYDKNNLFRWDQVYFVGMNKNHLYFAESYGVKIYETDLDGRNVRCFYDLNESSMTVLNETAVSVDYVTMNEETICFVYEVASSDGRTRTSSFALLNLHSGNCRFVTDIPYRTVEMTMRTYYVYATWAGMFDDCILFYNEDGTVRKMDLNTMQYSDFIPEVELSVGYWEDGYIPHCAKIGEWVYHYYSEEKTMLVRSKLDGSVICEYVATMDKDIKDVLYVDGRMIIELSDNILGNVYVEYKRK